MPNKANDGGPAFPLWDGDPRGSQDKGMSLRDWFAGMALQGLLADVECLGRNQMSVNEYANDAYLHADAMIRSRDK